MKPYLTCVLLLALLLVCPACAAPFRSPDANSQQDSEISSPTPSAATTATAAPRRQRPTGARMRPTGDPSQHSTPTEEQTTIATRSLSPQQYQQLERYVRDSSINADYTSQNAQLLYQYFVKQPPPAEPCFVQPREPTPPRQPDYLQRTLQDYTSLQGYRMYLSWVEEEFDINNDTHYFMDFTRLNRTVQDLHNSLTLVVEIVSPGQEEEEEVGGGSAGSGTQLQPSFPPHCNDTGPEQQARTYLRLDQFARQYIKPDLKGLLDTFKPN